MWNTIDRIFWVLVYLQGAGSWIAVTFFDWSPDPKWLAAMTFMALQFAASMQPPASESTSTWECHADGVRSFASRLGQ